MEIEGITAAAERIEAAVMVVREGKVASVCEIDVILSITQKEFLISLNLKTVSLCHGESFLASGLHLQG